MEASPVKPKLSALLSESLFDFTAATPIPKAIIKGTVIGPVVAPLASKAMAKYSLGATKAKIKTTI